MKEIYPNGLDGSYTKLDTNTHSQKSSSESLTSSSDVTQVNSIESTPKNNDHHKLQNIDKNFSFTPPAKIYQQQLFTNSDIRCSGILEHIEPISEGIKDQRNFNTHCLFKSQSFDEKSTSNITDIENRSLVHSWSYCISDSDNFHTELELSTSAEDFFKDTDSAIVNDILNEIIDRVCGDECVEVPNDLKYKKFGDVDPRTGSGNKLNFKLYPMHQYMCLYCDVFDFGQVLYALNTLKMCILTNSQLFIRLVYNKFLYILIMTNKFIFGRCLATAGLKDFTNNEIINLLARHRKSQTGQPFTGDLHPEHVTVYRGYMLLDVIVLICLNFSTSYYFCDDTNVSEEDIVGNLQIQLKSLEILEVIVRNLITVVNDSSKGFGVYIADVLLKCKLQKVVLHLLLTSVRNFDKDMTFAEEVLLFNKLKLYDTNKKVSEHVEAFQLQLLR